MKRAFASAATAAAAVAFGAGVELPSSEMTPARTHDLLQRHDLLRLHPRASLIFDAPAPDWVAVCLAETPWVVVRLGETRGGLIPIRVRGPAREQRHDALISASSFAYRSTPEDLAGRRCEPWRAAQVPALAALARVDPVLTRRGCVWGPTGSIAFELATRLPASTPACDLDLVLRQEEPPSFRHARELLRELAEAAAPARIDVLIETRRGGINLASLAL